MDNLQYYRELLVNNGYKFTIQKKTILEELINNKTHRNAEEMHDKVKWMNIGISTVYRTLKTFSKLGIVEEININNICYYELKPYKTEDLFIHFKCSTCGSIIDIDSSELPFNKLDLKKTIEEKYNISLQDANVVLTGICDDCSKKGDTYGECEEVI